jgi:hypothetical protein
MNFRLILPVIYGFYFDYLQLIVAKPCPLHQGKKGDRRYLRTRC